MHDFLEFGLGIVEFICGFRVFGFHPLLRVDQSQNDDVDEVKIPHRDRPLSQPGHVATHDETQEDNPFCIVILFSCGHATL